MELTHLRYFVRVAETQSFARGAALSHVTPPAISKAIRLLEETLGEKLFHRTTRKVVLTDAGRILLARCRNIFDEVEGIQRDLDEASGAIAGVVRIGAMEVFSIHLLPLALASLVKHNPAVVPHTYEMHPADMARHVVEGRLDVGFTIGASPRAGLDIAPLGTSPGVVVCGRSHPLYARARLRTADRNEAAFVVPRFFQREELQGLDQFDDDSWPRRVGATMELMQLGIQLAVAGAYLGHFPEITVRQHLETGTLRALRGGPRRAAFELQMLTRAGVPVRGVVDALVNEMRRRLATSSASSTGVV